MFIFAEHVASPQPTSSCRLLLQPLKTTIIAIKLIFLACYVLDQARKVNKHYTLRKRGILKTFQEEFSYCRCCPY